MELTIDPKSYFSFLFSKIGSPNSMTLWEKNIYINSCHLWLLWNALHSCFTWGLSRWKKGVCTITLIITKRTDKVLYICMPVSIVHINVTSNIKTINHLHSLFYIKVSFSGIYFPLLESMHCSFIHLLYFSPFLFI